MEKRTMVLNKLETLLPGQEREFLVFMAECDGSGINDFSNYSLEMLLDIFIGFEESNGDGEELNEEWLDEVLRVYIPGFERGEHVF
jgi:hypothetical protein